MVNGEESVVGYSTIGWWLVVKKFLRNLLCFRPMLEINKGVNAPLFVASYFEP
jgi:hypothetical protein